VPVAQHERAPLASGQVAQSLGESDELVRPGPILGHERVEGRGIAQLDLFASELGAQRGRADVRGDLVEPGSVLVGLKAAL
jgi:hypothetical protein